MDEFRLLELKEYRDRIIKKHIIFITLSFCISILFTIIYFLVLKYKNSFLLLFILIVFHSPMYIYILMSEKKHKKKYQFCMGITLVLILFYSSSIILFKKTKFYQILLYLITLCIYHYTEFFSKILFHQRFTKRCIFNISK